MVDYTTGMNIKLVAYTLWLVGAKLFAWGQPVQQCLIKGNIKGLQNQSVRFTFQTGNESITDTVFAVNDSFTYVAKAPADSIINFSVAENYSSFFWYEPGTITMAGSIDGLDKLQIAGTSENEVLSLFRQQVERVYPNRVETAAGKMIDNPKKNQATIEFITRYPDFQTSLYLLFKLTVFNPLEAKKYNVLYQDFSPKVRTSKVGKQLGEMLSEF